MRDKGKSDHFSLQNLVKTERHVCCICGLQVSFDEKKRCAFSRGLDMKGRREILMTITTGKIVFIKNNDVDQQIKITAGRCKNYRITHTDFSHKIHENSFKKRLTANCFHVKSFERGEKKKFLLN